MDSLNYQPGTDFTITSKYGWRAKDGKWKFHNGIDYSAKKGTGIPSAREGKVVYTGTSEGYGNVVVIEHQTEGKHFYTIYGHIAKDDIKVNPGDIVEKGQIIAKVGSTGTSSGTHLHFGVAQNPDAEDGRFEHFNRPHTGASVGFGERKDEEIAKGLKRRYHDPDTFEHHPVVKPQPPQQDKTKPGSPDADAVRHQRGLMQPDDAPPRQTTWDYRRPGLGSAPEAAGAVSPPDPQSLPWPGLGGFGQAYQPGKLPLGRGVGQGAGALSLQIAAAALKPGQNLPDLFLGRAVPDNNNANAGQEDAIKLQRPAIAAPPDAPQAAMLYGSGAAEHPDDPWALAAGQSAFGQEAVNGGNPPSPGPYYYGFYHEDPYSAHLDGSAAFADAQTPPGDPAGPGPKLLPGQTQLPGTMRTLGTFVFDGLSLIPGAFPGAGGIWSPSSLAEPSPDAGLAGPLPITAYNDPFRSLPMTLDNAEMIALSPVPAEDPLDITNHPLYPKFPGDTADMNEAPPDTRTILRNAYAIRELARQGLLFGDYHAAGGRDLL